MELVERTSKAIDDKEYTMGVFLDRSKAFDKVTHSILLHKVEHSSKRGVALEWFNNYLSNRKQVVNYNTLSLPKVNTTKYGLNSFRYFAAKQWNSIPNELRLRAGGLEFNKQVRNIQF